MTNTYVKNQLSQLQNDDDNKAAIQLRGGKGGKTKWLSITDEQLEDIKAVMINGENAEIEKLRLQLDTCSKVFHDTEEMKLKLVVHNKNLKTVLREMFKSEEGYYHWKNNMASIVEEFLKDE